MFTTGDGLLVVDTSFREEGLRLVLGYGFDMPDGSKIMQEMFSPLTHVGPAGKETLVPASR